MIQGICDLCERYNEFLKSYQLVRKATHDYTKNRTLYDSAKLDKESQKITAQKKLFENKLLLDVSHTTPVYVSEYNQIVEKFKNLIVSVNSEENQLIKQYMKYYGDKNI